MAFLGECLSAFIWLFGYFLMYNLSDQRTAYYCAKLVYIGVIFIPVFFYQFTLAKDYFMGLKKCIAKVDGLAVDLK